MTPKAEELSAKHKERLERILCGEESVDLYQQFLDAKKFTHQAAGFADARSIQLSKHLFDWQRDVVHWALRVGRADIWEECGLGKSLQFLEWSRVVHERTNQDVIILTPLAVAAQTKREGEKFDIEVTVCRSQADVQRGLNVTNYERLDKFDPDKFGAIVLDESAILKCYEGSVRKRITDFAARISYRLGASATPAPNDFMELGTQSEFVGSLTRAEMLATFFVHDGGETSKWRLKRHAEDEFWKWISTWAVYVRKPSDLGYSDEAFILPPMTIHQHTVESAASFGDLFTVEAKSLNERRAARRESQDKRVEVSAGLVNGDADPWIVWCDLNAESKALAEAMPDAIEVTGAMPMEEKEERLEAFTKGQARAIVSKKSIAGWGLNWQHCWKQVNCGLSDSFEQYYQGTRRSWRYGQKHPVEIHNVTSEAEAAVVRNIERKEADAARMAERISEHMKDLMQAEVRGVRKGGARVEPRTESGTDWRISLGDAVPALRNEPDNSADYSIFSPAFASLYTYSDALADMGNCKTHAEFYEHFSFCVPELFRVLKSGRNLSFHCMNLPASKERDGYIGMWDFRGEMIRRMQMCQTCGHHIGTHYDDKLKAQTCGAYNGFYFHSEVCIWKDPVTAMQRTKAIGLLYKQLRKDSTISRQGIADYLVTMRKPGVNLEPVTKVGPPVGTTFKHPRNVPANEFSVGEWQNHASPVWNDIEEKYLEPVWMDIDPGDTLTKKGARENDDERHICPLQLEVIRRAVRLWTNPGDVVLSPFAGIGSEGYIAVQMGRKFLGMELKESYFRQAILNLKTAHQSNMTLFDEADCGEVEEDWSLQDESA